MTSLELEVSETPAAEYFNSEILLSVIVPCFNEDEAIDALLERTLKASREVFGARFELILVDDGSTDQTWTQIQAATESHRQVLGVKLSRNHGHQLALTAGLAISRGRWIFIIDADLQDPPELLGGMFERLQSEGADVVFGKRISRKDESLFKKLSARAFYRLLARNSDINLPLDAGDFRLMTRRVADILIGMPEPDRFVRGMVSWIGLKQLPFEYHRDARFAGETKYPVKNMVRLAVQAIMGFSMLPLKFARFLSGLMFFVMLCVVGYAAVSYIFFATVSGWTSLMILVAFSSAIQLLVLSVLGEYMGRLYLASKNRPLFVVEKVLGAQEAYIEGVRHKVRASNSGVVL